MNIHKMKRVLIALDYNPTTQKVAETGFLTEKVLHHTSIPLIIIPTKKHS